MTNPLLAVSLISSALRCTALRPHCVSSHRDHASGPPDLATISNAAQRLIPACGDIDSCAHVPCQSKIATSHWTARRFCNGCLGGGAGSLSQGLRVLV